MNLRDQRGQSLAEYAIIAGIMAVVFLTCAILLEQAVAVYHDHVTSVVCLPIP